MDERAVTDIVGVGKGARDIGSHLLVLYSIALGLNAQKVLEVGVRFGNSTISFLHAMKETGGVLYSVDKDQCDVAVERVRKRGLDSCWYFTVQDSNEYAKSWKGSLDLLFIDGDHTFYGAAADFRNFSKYVRNGGIILLHDSYCSSKTVVKGNIGVHKLVESIARGEFVGLGYANDFEVVTLPYGYGMTIVRKLS